MKQGYQQSLKSQPLKRRLKMYRNARNTGKGSSRNLGPTYRSFSERDKVLTALIFADDKQELRRYRRDRDACLTS